MNIEMTFIPLVEIFVTRPLKNHQPQHTYCWERAKARQSWLGMAFESGCFDVMKEVCELLRTCFERIQIDRSTFIICDFSTYTQGHIISDVLYRRSRE